RPAQRGARPPLLVALRGRESAQGSHPSRSARGPSRSRRRRRRARSLLARSRSAGARSVGHRSGPRRRPRGRPRRSDLARRGAPAHVPRPPRPRQARRARSGPRPRHRRGRDEGRRIRSARARSAARRAYPLAFREQIAKASKIASMPPDLLQALMREESALDPRALSSTGALGLTQVMPGTAREIARRLKLHGFVPSKLFDPEVSIRIGGAYLGELYARFQHPALAFASYNAGPGAVSSWLSKRKTLPLDVFGEEIPLVESR